MYSRAGNRERIKKTQKTDVARKERLTESSLSTAALLEKEGSKLVGFLSTNNKLILSLAPLGRITH